MLIKCNNVLIAFRDVAKRNQQYLQQNDIIHSHIQMYAAQKATGDSTQTKCNV